MKRSSAIFVSSIIAAMLVFACWTGNVRAEANAVADDSAVAAAEDISTDYIIIKLQDPAAASYEGGIKGIGRTKPLKSKFDPNSGPARAYLRYLDRSHGQYRSWLARNARGAQVVRDYRVTFNGMAIKLNGALAAKAAGGPGAKAWAYSTIHYPSMNVSVPLIGADVLQAPSPPNAGSGVQIAIIDSGIQAGHPFFACKTVQHHGPYYSGEAPNPPFSPFPIIYSTHGTHVAGIAAGCYSDLATIDPGSVVTGAISGVAPGATLHDFNVFPGIGSAFWNGIRKTGNVSAYSHDIAQAIEDAVKLGVDVINMSLGGGVQGPNDFLANFADGAVDAGVVVCASIGNEGPGDATAGSPGTGRKVISSGMTSNPHFVGIPVTVAGTTYGAAVGDFNNFDVVTGADYTVTTPANGCAPITTDLTGKIAIIDRGVCTFSTKIRNAQNAGAIGVIVVNNRAGDPSAMGQDGTPNQPTIPAVMLARDNGNAIKPSGTVDIDGTNPTEFHTSNADIIALDSSRGPAPFTYIIKPDVSSPGDNVYSSVFNFGNTFNDITYDFEFFRGTSMASPHTAGSAALLLAQHPGWSPADVRSALVNTAARVVTDSITGTQDPGVLARGGGRIDLVPANTTPLTFDPAMVSFGFWSGNKTAEGSVAVKVRNVSGSSQSVTATVTGPSIVSVSPTSLTLSAGDTATLTVTLNAGASSQSASGDYDGDVVVTSGSTTLNIPWFVRIDRRGKQ